MIQLARVHAAASTAATRLQFDVADVARLPFPDNHFDVVMSSGSIKHWPDPVAGLRELHRVLVPGGRARIVEMNRNASPEAVAAQRTRLRSWFFRRIYPRIFTQSLNRHHQTANRKRREKSPRNRLISQTLESGRPGSNRRRPAWEWDEGLDRRL
jgi:ubiquinone/menaquinone biosynthesis C-methylase UbiE